MMRSTPARPTPIRMLVASRKCEVNVEDRNKVRGKQVVITMLKDLSQRKMRDITAVHPEALQVEKLRSKEEPRNLVRVTEARGPTFLDSVVYV